MEGYWPSSGAGLRRRAVRNVGLQLAAEIASKVAVLGLFVVLAHHLGPERFGEFVFAVSVAILVTTLAGLGTDEIVARQVARDPAEIGTVLWDALSVKVAAGLLAVGGVTALAILGDYDTEVRLTLVLVAGSGFTDLLAATLYGVFQGLNDLAPEAGARSLQSGLRAGAGVAVVLAGGGIVALAAVYLATSLVALGYVTRLLRSRVRLGRRRVSLAASRALTATAFPIAVGGVLEILVLGLTTVILAAFKGNDAVGLFGAASRLVEGIAVLSAAVSAAALPLLARAGDRGAPAPGAVYETANKALVAVLVPIAAAMLLFADPIVRILFGGGFLPAVPVLRIMAGVVLLDGFSRISWAALVARGRQAAIAWIAGVAAVIALGLVLLLVPSHSATGAAVAVLASAFAYAVLTTGLAIRVMGRISLRPLGVGPLAGTAAMGLIALIAGTGATGMALAAVGYAIVALAVERLLNPHEIALLRGLPDPRRRLLRKGDDQEARQRRRLQAREVGDHLGSLTRTPRPDA